MASIEALKDIPGYKAILKTVLKSQIQGLLQQLSEFTEEESIILTASINDGSLSHLGSTLGKGFFDGREEIKSQFLGYCLKALRGQQEQQSQGNSISSSISQNSSIEHRSESPYITKRPKPYERLCPNYAMSNNHTLKHKGSRVNSSETDLHAQIDPNSGVDLEGLGQTKLKTTTSRLGSYKLNTSLPYDKLEFTQSTIPRLNTSLPVFPSQINSPNTSACDVDLKQERDSESEQNVDSDATTLKREMDSDVELVEVEEGSVMLGSEDTSLNTAGQLLNFGDVSLEQLQKFRNLAFPETDTENGRYLGEKEFRCDVCFKEFKCKQNLTRHYRIHSGSKPYQCPYCERSFRMKHHLHGHVYSVHSDKLNIYFRTPDDNISVDSPITKFDVAN